MRRQDGVIDSKQLAGLGFGPNVVTRLVRDGLLVRRFQGVYVDALAPLSLRGELRAALLACGPTAFLSHRTALARHGVRRLDTRAIEVTVVAGHTPRIDGLRVHRTSSEPPPEEIRIVDGLRTASPARALVDAAARERPRELDRLIAELARRRLLRLDQLDAAIARRSGVRGIVKLRAALSRYRPPSADDASTLERDVVCWLAAHPEIPTPRRNVHIEHGGVRWELDLHWPEYALAAEIDGSPYHLTPGELERDRVKDAWLQRHHIRVIRITAFRFEHDRSGILEDLRAFTSDREAA